MTFKIDIWQTDTRTSWPT